MDAVSRRKNKQRLNWIKLAEKNRIPLDSKCLNPRIKFDGLHWWLTVGVEHETKPEIPSVHDPPKPLSEGIGIDLGIKTFAVCSDGIVYPNINKTKTVKKLKKQRRRLQRSISRSYENNKKGVSYCKTCNIIKREKSSH